MNEHSTTSPLLDEERTAALLGVSERTLQGWRARNEGPVFIKLGRTVRYRQSDLSHWIDACAKETKTAAVR